MDGKRIGTLESTLSKTKWNSIEGFINDFKANGRDFIVNNIYNPFHNDGDYLNGDVGSIILGNTVEDVVTGELTSPASASDPMEHWIEDFTLINADTLAGSIKFRTGAKAGQSIELNLIVESKEFNY